MVAASALCPATTPMNASTVLPGPSIHSVAAASVAGSAGPPNHEQILIDFWVTAPGRGGSVGAGPPRVFDHLLRADPPPVSGVSVPPPARWLVERWEPHPREGLRQGLSPWRRPSLIHTTVVGATAQRTNLQEGICSGQPQTAYAGR
ncbi:hypothetical protein HEB94_001592 [Actinopolymorpha pittospori]|uniref:Uncharacterized protein n=1 Tax=Actinopolymorpha pittospori TaxID=648752 RepID=A0A927R7Y6_9ACTN|nr:hypothetical protein [Actinopolymorpha pittospori]